ncbi:MAG: enoyl-CoA hydratase/isomerase family protein [Desulfobacteraceae bacterium]|nr:enoyl-CoA hydratase/isomerase family protein [Desulfobacteraceae bacterium]
MEHVIPTQSDGVLTLRLRRGKVNAISEQFLAELNSALDRAESSPDVRSVVLTGSGKFFSFGFDIPEFLSYSKEAFTKYLKEFAGFYARVFLFPKPVVAALNGHTVAGACMIAIACDYRIMNEKEGRISLNEITFGSSVFAGSVEILKELVGPRNARDILYSGAMYTPAEAKEIGLVDELVDGSGLERRALDVARTLGEKDPAAFASVKRLLRRSAADRIARYEERSLEEFVEIWYSEATWANLKKITIRS